MKSLFKKIAIFSFAIVPFALLFGCAVPDKYYDGIENANTNNATIGVKALETNQKQTELIMKYLADNGNDTAMVLFGLLNNQQVTQVVSLLKSQRPADPTDPNDVWKVALGGNSVIGTGIKWMTGAWAFGKLFDGSVGNSYVLAEGAHMDGSFNPGANMGGNWSPWAVEAQGEGTSASGGSGPSISTSDDDTKEVNTNLATANDDTSEVVTDPATAGEE